MSERVKWFIAVSIVASIVIYFWWNSSEGFVDTSKIDNLASAIAFAEGFYAAYSRPARNNNPGDLTYAFGYPTMGQDGPFPIFATVDDGWLALKKQVSEMLDDTSKNFKSTMTIAQIGIVYAGGDPGGNWARNVAQYLGVTTDTVIGTI